MFTKPELNVTLVVSEASMFNPGGSLDPVS